MRSRISAVVLRADVGRDQRVFQLLQNLGVDLLASADGVFKLLHQARARLLDAGFQAFEKTGFRRWRWRGSEERLKHVAELLV